MRLVAIGDKLYYEQDTGALAASILETKLLLNSLISVIKQGARFLSCDLIDLSSAHLWQKLNTQRLNTSISLQTSDKNTNSTIKWLQTDTYIYIYIHQNKERNVWSEQEAMLALDNIVKNSK